MQASGRSSSFLRILSEDEEKVSARALALAEQGDRDRLLELLEKGLKLHECRGLFGYSCLHHACNRGHMRVVAELLKHDAEVDARDDSGESPLHLACYAGQLLIVDMLLDKGADINALNAYLETPLFYAAKRGMPAVTRLLLQRGANPLLENQFGDRAVDVAHDERTRLELTYRPVLQQNEYLSFDILLLVFGYLTPREVCRCACVSGKWHRVAESEEVWRRFPVRRWEMALHSSLGFPVAPSASFTRRGSK